MDEETLQKIASELELFFSPLIVGAKESDILFEYIAQTGWHLEGQLGTSENNLFSQVAVITGFVEDLVALTETPPDDAGDILALVTELLPLINAIRQLPDSLSSINLPEIGEISVDV